MIVQRQTGLIELMRYFDQMLISRPTLLRLIIIGYHLLVQVYQHESDLHRNDRCIRIRRDIDLIPRNILLCQLRKFKLIRESE